MRSKYYIVIISVLFVICILINASYANDPVNLENKVSNFALKNQIIERAASILGLDSISSKTREGLVEKSDFIDVVDSTTPYISSIIDGSRILRVEFDSVVLKLRKFNDTGRLNFIVFIDPEPGELIKITSKKDEFNLGDWKISSAKEQEKILGSEKYCGIPKVDPKISFIEALDSIIKNPLKAFYIEGLYVLHSSSDETPRPVWNIKVYTTKEPPENINYNSKLGYPMIRSVVDAMDGKFIMGSNF